jgi:hypothetical protein
VSLDGQAIFAGPQHKKEARVRTQADRPDRSGADRKFTLADVSVALCAGAMLLATLLTLPLATPAAQAAVSVARAATTTDEDTPERAERTVFLPELYLPVSGGISVPIDQF